MIDGDCVIIWNDIGREDSDIWQERGFCIWDMSKTEQSLGLSQDEGAPCLEDLKQAD